MDVSGVFVAFSSFPVLGVRPLQPRLYVFLSVPPVLIAKFELCPPTLHVSGNKMCRWPNKAVSTTIAVREKVL